MRTKIVEATNGVNYGKFLLGIFDEGDRTYRSALPENEGRALLRSIGFGNAEDALWVLDLQTGEGCVLYPHSGADPVADLEKHKVWVCPMFEHFLAEWVYSNARKALALDVPALIELKTEFAALYGYRRSGGETEKKT